MGQNGVGRSGSHHLALGVHHQIGLDVDGPLIRFLVQEPHRHQGLLKDRLHQLTFVVHGHIGRDVLLAGSCCYERSHTLRKRLLIRLSVGQVHHLEADVLDGTQVAVHLVLAVLQNVRVGDEVLPHGLSHQRITGNVVQHVGQ